MSQFGIEVTRRNLNVQPTLRIHAGYRFNIRVSRDLLFDGQYHFVPFPPKLEPDR
jgi:type IV secretion system protein VirB10